MLKAVDEASAVLSGAADKIKGSMGQVEGATAKVETAQRKTDSSCKDLVTGFSGVATGAFALYMTVDRVEKSQYALEKANLAVQRSNEAVDQAQKSYNAAVEKFGVNSTQAKDASDKLAIAQDAFALANDRASLAQGNVNQAMMQGALTIIPTLITIGSSASKALDGMTKAQDGLNTSMLANPIFLVIVAVTALIAVLVTAYYTIEPFRNAVDSLGRFLGLLPPAVDDAIAATAGYQKATESANRSVLEAQKRTQDVEFAAANFTNTLLDTARQVSSYDELLTRNCRTLDDYRGLSDDASAAVEVLQEKMKSLQADCEAVNRVLEDQKDNFGEGSAAVSLMGRDTDRLTVSEREHGGQIEELNRQIAENTSLTEQQVAEIKKQIEELEAAAKHAEEVGNYIEELGNSYNIMQAKASPAIADVAYQWKAYVDSGNIEEAARLADEWGSGFNLVVSDAGELLADFISIQEETTKAARDFRNSLEEDYAVLVLKSGESFAKMATFYQDAFAAGKLDLVEAFVNQVAAAMELDPSQVASIFASYEEPLKKVEDALGDFTKNITNEWSVQKASADETLPAIANQFNVAFDRGMFDAAAQVVRAFANKYGIIFNQAEGIINSFTDAQAKELAQQVVDTQKAADAQTAAQQKLQDAMLAHADKLKSDFFDRVTSESLAFKDEVMSLATVMVDSWNSMSGVTDADAAAMTASIQGFADQWGINWDEAEAIITKAADGIDSEMGRIPDSIENQLIGRAQANLEAFEKCATGKFATIEGNSKASWDTIVQDTNSLISSGLIGQAQANIKAFVDCSTGKQAKMVDDIDGYLTQLAADYASNTEQVNALVSQGKDAEAAIYQKKGAEILAAIQQLEDWRNRIITASWVATNLTVNAGLATELSAISTAAGRLEALKASFGKAGVDILDIAKASAAASASAASAALPTQTSNTTPTAAGLKQNESGAWYEERAGRRLYVSPEQIAAMFPGYAEGGVVTRPTMLIAGEAGPEAIVPLDRYAFGLVAKIGASEKPSVSIQISGPLVYVEGSADRATAELAVDLAMEKLKSVIVEASSSGAPVTSKMIRVGNRVGI